MEVRAAAPAPGKAGVGGTCAHRTQEEPPKMVLKQRVDQFMRSLKHPTLTARTTAAMSLLFLIAIWGLASFYLHSFRNQTKDLIVEEQNALVDRIADDLDQRLRYLQKALTDSA